MKRLRRRLRRPFRYHQFLLFVYQNRLQARTYQHHRLKCHYHHCQQCQEMYLWLRHLQHLHHLRQIHQQFQFQDRLVYPNIQQSHFQRNLQMHHHQ